MCCGEFQAALRRQRGAHVQRLNADWGDALASAACWPRQLRRPWVVQGSVTVGAVCKPEQLLSTCSQRLPAATEGCATQQSTVPHRLFLCLHPAGLRAGRRPGGDAGKPPAGFHPHLCCSRKLHSQKRPGCSDLPADKSNSSQLDAHIGCQLSIGRHLSAGTDPASFPAAMLETRPRPKHGARLSSCRWLRGWSHGEAEGRVAVPIGSCFGGLRRSAAGTMTQLGSLAIVQTGVQRSITSVISIPAVGITSLSCRKQSIGKWRQLRLKLGYDGGVRQAASCICLRYGPKHPTLGALCCLDTHRPA